MRPQTGRFDAIRAKVQEVAAKAKDLYGVDLSNAAVSFNLRGKVAGWARCRYCAGQKEVSFRFNCDMITGNHFEDIRDETVAHELAHGVCFLRPDLGRDHNDGWIRVCRALGGSGRPRHDYEVKYAGGYDYMTDQGHVVHISPQRHAKIQQGHGYIFRGKGKINRYSRFCRTGHKMPDVSPNGRVIAEITMPRMGTPTVTRPALGRPVPTQSKAAVVRGWIRDAKARGLPPEYVGAMAVKVLGMKEALAKVYVLGNWDKV